jgi:DNA-binding response OmpR family regulator
VRIGLPITDVGLPKGMNGRQMADAAREARPTLKVLFFTSYAENAAVGNGHLEPGMHLLTKPFAMEMLASRIKPSSRKANRGWAEPLSYSCKFAVITLFYAD